MKNGVCPDSIGAGSLRVSLRCDFSPLPGCMDRGGWSKGFFSTMLDFLDRRRSKRAQGYGQRSAGRSN